MVTFLKIILSPKIMGWTFGFLEIIEISRADASAWGLVYLYVNFSYKTSHEHVAKQFISLFILNFLTSVFIHFNQNGIFTIN